MKFRVEQYERCETMNAGSIEDHLIGITKPSIDRMLKMENPADCIALYTFYCYTKKWQKNNAVFATSEFAMKALSWGRDKFSKAKTQLKEAGFIEDIQRKDSTGKIIGWFVGVRFAQSATLGNFHTTEIPDCGKSGDKYLKLINEIPNTNKQIQEESSAVASHSSVELNQPNLFPTENTANAKESFATAQRNDPPTEANAKTTAARKKSPPTNIPTELDTPEFNACWNEFLQHRKEKKTPMTPTAQNNMFRKFTAWGVENAVSAIDTAISNGWTGVFEPKQNKFNSKPERFCNI